MSQIADILDKAAIKMSLSRGYNDIGDIDQLIITFENFNSTDLERACIAGSNGLLIQAERERKERLKLSAK